jgi:hypothetical protein
MAFWGLFSGNSIKVKNEPIQVKLMDSFENNSNGWVESDRDNPPFIQRIENCKLYLESTSNEMGVISSIYFNLNESKDFQIEIQFKIQNINNDYFSTFDFGIFKQKNAFRKVSGLNIPTTYGDKNFYFGYNRLKEICIAEWNKGKENYFYREFHDSIKLNDFNQLLIKKMSDKISYYFNNEMIYQHKYKKLFGSGFGFATAPNSKLWVNYIIIKN